MMLQTHLSPRRNNITVSEYRSWVNDREGGNTGNAEDYVPNLDVFEPDPINLNNMKVVERYDFNLVDCRLFPCLPSSHTFAKALPITPREDRTVPFPFGYLPSAMDQQATTSNIPSEETSFRYSQQYLQIGSIMNLIEREVDINHEQMGDNASVSPAPHRSTTTSLTTQAMKATTIHNIGSFASLAVHPTLTRSKSETSQYSVSARSADSNRSKETYDDRWDVKFGQLQQFVQMHGHARVPVRYRLNMSLSKWAKRQRYQYKLKQEGKHSTLSDERELKLVDLGFEWDIRCTVWEERFDELVEFKLKHGHMSVPIICPDFPKLGSWVKCARRQGKLLARGEPSSMTADRAAKLQAIGFTWDARGCSETESY
jgi:Helicase associated domain